MALRLRRSKSLIKSVRSYCVILSGFVYDGVGVNEGSVSLIDDGTFLLCVGSASSLSMLIEVPVLEQEVTVLRCQQPNK